MPIGDVFYEIQQFGPGEGPQGQGFLAKVTVEDPKNYNVTTDETGRIIFTPKPVQAPVPAPVTAPLKYELELADDGSGLYKVVATRAIQRWGVMKGERGGLVANSESLSQRGDCWVFPGAKVLDHSRVTEDATVRGESVLSGGAGVSHRATIVSSVLSGGGVMVQGGAVIVGSTISTVDYTRAGVYISGDSRIEDSRIEAAETLNILGCNLEDAVIRKPFELVTIATPYGWLNAYPDEHGDLMFKIGCTTVRSIEELRSLATRNDHDEKPHDMAMLQAFLDMVAVAQQSWTQPKAAEPETPALRPGSFLG